MNAKEAISEIVKVNKVIVDNGLDKLVPRTKEMTNGYNNNVKPLLEKFKSKFGKTDRNFIKEILSKCQYLNINDLTLKSFGNWGSKINPYIWASFYTNNENKRPASHSIQLYILIDHLGIKFGFDYGDKIENNDEYVKSFLSDENIQNLILRNIQKNNLEVINLKAGSPNIIYNHKKENNIIKEKDDFKLWNKDIHIIKSYLLDNIPNNIEEEIIDVVNSFLPLYNTQLNPSKVLDVGYWLYAAGANAKDWENQFDNNIMSIDYDFPDNLKEIHTRDELDKLVEEYDLGSYNTSYALWQFAKEINIGDVIISKKGRTSYLGYGIVSSDYIFDEEKPEYRHIRKVKWIKKGNWKVEGKLPVKTLTNITQYSDYVEKLKIKLGINSKNDKKIGDEFNLDKILENVFIDKGDFQNIVDILSTKKNIILQGSAGVGKTFIAKKIAQALQEDYSEERIEMIQFHQSYSYEDFIQGYRPNNDSFELKNGIFYDVCERAKEDTSVPYFLIIDEINRGNLSKIFGELMMLIEADKRGEKNKIKLAYSANEEFYIPDNLYIIGTMNTADRSLTIVDYALRRRFAFIKMKPKYNEQFEAFLLKKGISKEIISSITNKMKTLNNIINSDDSLGDGFEIGHSYFCSYKSGEHNKWLANVFKYEIIPLIEEYWFDDHNLIDEYTSIIES